MRPPPTVELGCDAGLYLTEGENGSVSCAPANGTKSQFFITDIFGSFASGSDGGPSGDVSMSDTVYDGIFTKIVTDNIFGEFTDANFAAIVFFAIFFAVAINQVFLVEGESAKAAEGEGDVIIRFLKALDKIFLKMIQWVIMVTPFAVFSLITQAIGEQDDIAEAFSNVGFLIVAFVVGIILQFLVVHVGMFFFFTKRNPFVYLKHIIPAQTMAFACASSAATIPVTLKSVRSTGWVPEPILRFVVPLGATVNMDGSAIYYPMACVWLVRMTVLGLILVLKSMFLTLNIIFSLVGLFEWHSAKSS
jgi:solute carrier family 1 (high affinity glutamate transporter) protein 2